MNCLEFRRRLRDDHGRDDAAFAEHRGACAGCAQAARDEVDWERRLEAAARVGVPSELASRILLRQALTERRPRRRVWAAAAALVLAAGIGAFGALKAPGWLNPPDRALQQAVIEVIEKETYALAARGPVADAAMAAALARAGVSLDGPIGEVRFAEPCWVRGKIAAHLVIASRAMPVTVFLMPHERVERRELFRLGHLSGVLLPAGSGAIAIVGAPDEDLEPVAARVLPSVRWRT